MNQAANIIPLFDLKLAVIRPYPSIHYSETSVSSDCGDLQEAVLFMATAVRTSNATCCVLSSGFSTSVEPVELLFRTRSV
jgi:hypothetical protein